MPFDHNDHYHPLLMRQLPRDCARALDVGCGTGRFARRLARLGIAVDAIDRSAAVIATARDWSSSVPDGRNPRYQQVDVTEADLPQGHYDFISCLASIHHVPFETVIALRGALTSDGVLVILGCYPEQTWTDWLWSMAAVPVNIAVRAAIAVRDALRSAGGSGRLTAKAPVTSPVMPLPQIRRRAGALLPGCTIRRLLFWRYLLVFRNGTLGAT